MSTAWSPAFAEPGPRLAHLNGEIFYSLKEAHIVIEQSRKHFNTVRADPERI
jgi:hypothetical protein